MLAMDGYGSHTMHPSALRKLFVACILCVCFPSHTSSALQALDVGLFGPMKRAFVQQLSRHHWIEQEGATKWQLLVIMHLAVLKSFTFTNIKSAFRAVGQYPLDVDWCLHNQHKFAISSFLRKTESIDDAPTTLSWRSIQRDPIPLYESMVADYGATNGKDLFANMHRLPGTLSLASRDLHTVCRCNRMGFIDDLGTHNFEQLQRIIDATCATRHKVLMRRAVDSTFELPEMTKERRAKRHGRRNVIDELFSAAKVVVVLYVITSPMGPKPKTNPRSSISQPAWFCLKKTRSRRQRRPPKSSRGPRTRSCLWLPWLGRYCS